MWRVFQDLLQISFSQDLILTLSYCRNVSPHIPGCGDLECCCNAASWKSQLFSFQTPPPMMLTFVRVCTTSFVTEICFGLAVSQPFSDSGGGGGGSSHPIVTLVTVFPAQVLKAISGRTLHFLPSPPSLMHGFEARLLSDGRVEGFW
jgi:hypothetical protein